MCVSKIEAFCAKGNGVSFDNGMRHQNRIIETKEKWFLLHGNSPYKFFPDKFILQETNKNHFLKELMSVVVLLVVFSACGGIRTGINLPVLTAYFPVLAEGILGKGGLFVTPPLEDCLNGLFYPNWNDLQHIDSSVADCLALTWQKCQS